jgi:hypothetical protein
MAQSAQSAVLEDDLSDSDRPLLEALHSRKKDRLARENIDEGIARLQGIPRSHGRRYFGTVKPLKVPPQGSISLEAPRPSTRGRRKAGRPPRAKGIPVATNDAPQWHLVKPSYSNVKPRVQESDLDISAASFVDTPSCKPRIWASVRRPILPVLFVTDWQPTGSNRIVSNPACDFQARRWRVLGELRYPMSDS